MSAVTQAVTAVAAIGALVFTGMSLKLTQDQNLAQNNLTAQAQYTGRYADAVDQLSQQGVDRLQTRLGGIYALERLAHDSPRDQPTIIEVLASFVRSYVPHPPDGNPSSCPIPSADIAAAVSVLGRRDPRHDGGTRIDFGSFSAPVCLSGINLADSSLASVNLFCADLARTDLSGANLSDTNLWGANLSESDLSGADLSGADLELIHVSGVDLSGADLSGADLTNTSLDDVTDIANANLSHAHLTSADLSGLDLSGVNLSGANLSGANLSGVIHDSHTRVVDVVIDSNTKGKWW